MNSSRIIAILFLATVAFWFEYSFWVIGANTLLHTIVFCIVYVVHCILALVVIIALVVIALYILYELLNWIWWALVHSSKISFKDYYAQQQKRIAEEERKRNGG